MRDARFVTTVDFYDDLRGLVRAICELIIHRNPTYPNMSAPWMADCEIREVKGVLQRQQDIRAQVSLDTNFASERHGAFHGVIRNISAGGLYVTTSQPLDRGEMIAFKYKFRNVERLFQARTVRGTRIGDIEYGYGCVFVNLSDNAESTIREYVYKVLRDREKGKRDDSTKM